MAALRLILQVAILALHVFHEQQKQKPGPVTLTRHGSRVSMCDNQPGSIRLGLGFRAPPCSEYPPRKAGYGRLLLFTPAIWPSEVSVQQGIKSW